MNQEVFALLCIDIVFPYNSNIIGVYKSKDTAISMLMLEAGYTDTFKGFFLHNCPQREYSSYKNLYNIIEKNMEFYTEGFLYQISRWHLK